VKQERGIRGGRDIVCIGALDALHGPRRRVVGQSDPGAQDELAEPLGHALHQLTRQNREDLVGSKLHETQERYHATFTVVIAREQGLRGAQATQVVRNLALQKARGIGASDGQDSEIRKIRELQLHG
jgi:hypothetical protein